MILKNYQIVKLYEAIIEVINSDNDLSIKVLYKLNKNLKNLNELKNIIKEQNDQLIIKSYNNGEVAINETGKVMPIQGKENNYKNFMLKLNELYSIENEVFLDTFLIEDLENLDGISKDSKITILMLIEE